MVVLSAFLICAAALVGTLFVGREVNRRIREYGKDRENQARAEHSRSLDYENSTFSRMLIYILIYGIVFLMAIIALAVYLSRL